MSFRPVARSNDPQFRKFETDDREVFAGFINPNTGQGVKASEGYAVPTVYYEASDSLTAGIGDLLRLDGSDELVEPSEPFTSFVGVAADGVMSGVASDFFEEEVGVTPLKQELEGDNPVAKIVFATTDVNDTSPVDLHKNREVEVTKSGDEWFIDVSATDNPHVRIVEINSVTNEYFVQFLDSAIQSGA